ncbi:hypothetical protein CBR71_02965 [Bordetella hinzii]|nr:hypothetical protein CBR71_02965 [Bordetella hinzii]
MELAAKAAGIDYLVWTPGTSPIVPAERRIGGQMHWNPIHDDGDALRLGVRLKLKIYQAETAAIVHPRMSHGYVGEAYDDNGMDKYAATRRAIVRAAAEIGAKMQGK